MSIDRNVWLRLTDEEGMKRNGLPWATTDSARWAFRKRHENGLAKAFRRIGKCVHVNPAKVFELIERQPIA